MKRIFPTKSPNDSKEYVAIQLHNGLKLLIVSDPECDKCAVSVSVGVGSMNDPDGIPGLAHLCEHLLSVEIDDGTRKKPFNAFIAENGGMFNAFTSRDQTNFHFDIDPAKLQDALARFLEFFTKIPKLAEKDIHKEILIVDSEHLSKANKDSWRKLGVDASTAKKSHPFHKFTTGNKRTLLEIPKQRGLEIAQTSLDFKRRFYTPELMTAVVYGKDTLQNLETRCVKLFSQLSNLSQSRNELPQWVEWPYGENELRRQINVVPVADLRELFITFPIDNTRPHYKTFPHGYIARLLGSRGDGSLYSYLNKKQWIVNIFLNTSIPARGFGELSIGFQLTYEGLQNLETIILLTFQYIKMLKDKGPQLYFWKEMQELLYLQFLYPEREIPVDFVQRMSNLLHVYPLEDILIIGHVITNCDEALISKFLSYLTPENCRIITLSKQNEEKYTTFEEDHWYGAKYAISSFTKEDVENWTFCQTMVSFHLPNPNKFIPTDFTLKTKQSKEFKNYCTELFVKTFSNKFVKSDCRFSWSPCLIVETPLCTARFLQDTEFQVAKGVIRLEIFSPLPLTDSLSFNLNQLWFLTLKNMLGEEFYQATLACSYHDIKPTMYGAEITVSGFNDKLILLMEEIILRVLNSAKNISEIKKYLNPTMEKYKSGLMNYKNLPPQNTCTYCLSLLLREKRFLSEELLEELSDVRTEAFVNYITTFFFRTRFEWFVYGNFSKVEAESLVCKCLDHIKAIWNPRPLLSSQNTRLREVCVTPGNDFIFESQCSSGSACAVLIQAGILNMKEALLLEIIDQILYEPLFTQLRSREGIGYIVRSSVRKSNGCHGLLIFVQGDKQPSFLSERIFNALMKIEVQLKVMTKEEFDQHTTAVRIRKAEHPKSMLMLFNKLWNNEIFPHRYEFGRIAKELFSLNLVTKEEVVAFFQDRISNSSPSRQVLQVHLHSCGDFGEAAGGLRPKDHHTTAMLAKQGNAKKTVILDIAKWKRTMNLYSTDLPLD